LIFVGEKNAIAILIDLLQGKIGCGYRDHNAIRHNSGPPNSDPNIVGPKKFGDQRIALDLPSPDCQKTARVLANLDRSPEDVQKSKETKSFEAIPPQEWQSVAEKLQKIFTGKGFAPDDTRQRLDFNIGDLTASRSPTKRAIAQGTCPGDVDSILGFIGPDLSVLRTSVTFYIYPLGGKNLQSNLHIHNPYTPNKGTPVQKLLHRHFATFGGGDKAQFDLWLMSLRKIRNKAKPGEVLQNYIPEPMWENLMTNCFLPAVFKVIPNPERSTWPLIYQQHKLKAYAAMREGQLHGPDGTRMGCGLTLESQWLGPVWTEFRRLLKEFITSDYALYGVFRNFKLFVSCKGFKNATRGNDLIEAWEHSQHKVAEFFDHR
jgi:hypothetical protein